MKKMTVPIIATPPSAPSTVPAVVPGDFLDGSNVLSPVGEDVEDGGAPIVVLLQLDAVFSSTIGTKSLPVDGSACHIVKVFAS